MKKFNLALLAVSCSAVCVGAFAEDNTQDIDFTTIDAVYSVFDSENPTKIVSGFYINENQKEGKKILGLKIPAPAIAEKGNLFVGKDGELSGYDTLVKSGSNITVDNQSYIFGDTHTQRTFTIDLNKELTGLESVETKEVNAENATVSKNFTVQGDTKLNNLEVTGETNLKGDTTIDGNTQLKKDLTVDGNTNIEQNLTVNGDSNLKKITATTVNADDVNTKNVTADNGDIKNLKSEKAEVGGVTIENQQISGLQDATQNDQAVTYGQFTQAIASIGGGNQDLERRVNGLEERVDGLDGKINRVQKRADAGTAAAMAAAGLQSSIGPGRSVMSVSGAAFHGQSGYAIGYSTMTESGKIGLKAFGNADSRGRFGAGASVGYHW